MTQRKYVSFDWAIKSLLKKEKNYGVVAGLLTVLLGKNITVKRFLDTETSKDYPYDKICRYDLLAEDDNGDLYIFEIQNFAMDDYWQRILFGASQLVTETLMNGDEYGRVKKVYSISIVYFDLGDGDDYAYRGSMVFEGMGKGGQMTRVKRLGHKDTDIKDIFPEYIILKVKNFKEVSNNTPLEEWMQFLKSEKIDENTKVPGLVQAMKALDYLKMPTADRREFDAHAKIVSEDKSRFDTAMARGIAKGIAQGEAQGDYNRAKKDAIKLLSKGMSLQDIADVTELSLDEIESLRNENEI